MSNQRLMKAKEKAGDGYAKTNAIGGEGACRRRAREPGRGTVRGLAGCSAHLAIRRGGRHHSLNSIV